MFATSPALQRLLSGVLLLVLTILPTHWITAQETADDLAAQAQQMVDSGDLEAARDLLLRAIALDSTNGDLYYRLGDVYDSLGEYDLAIEAFNQILTLNPAAWWAQVRLGDIYGYGLGQHKTAIQAYTAALNALPETDAERSWPLHNRANAYNALGEYLSALQDMEAALTVNPSDFWNYMIYAETLVYLERFDDALDIVNRGIERIPNHFDLWRQRGWVYWQYGLYQQAQEQPDDAARNINFALADLDRAVALGDNRQQAEAYMLRAEIRISQEDYDAALQEYQAATNADDQNPHALNGLGSLLTHYFQDYEQGVSILTRALELLPDFPGILVNRAYAYMGLGDFTSAEADLGRALELEPTSADAYIARARLYAQIGHRYNETGDADPAHLNFRLAIDDLTQVIALNPPWVADAYHERAELYYYLHEYEQSMADYEILFDLGTGSPWAYIGASYVLMANSPVYDAGRALELAAQAAELAPDLPDAFENLGNIYYDLGRYQEALDSYRQCRDLWGSETGQHVTERIAELEGLLGSG